MVEGLNFAGCATKSSQLVCIAPDLSPSRRAAFAAATASICGAVVRPRGLSCPSDGPGVNGRNGLTDF